MKVKFIEDTANIRNLKGALAALQARNATLPGLGLITGPAGLGKTQAVRWYSTQYDTPYIRALATWTQRRMLQEICAELMQTPEYQTGKVFDQVKQELIARPRLIFIDEADFLTSNWKMLETIRDLHDLTGSSFVMVGMGEISGKLARHHQVWSRISQAVEFLPLTAQEIAFVARELTGLDLAGEVVGDLKKLTRGYFRDVMVSLSSLERIVAANNNQPVNTRMVQMAGKAVQKGGLVPRAA